MNFYQLYPIKLVNFVQIKLIKFVVELFTLRYGSEDARLVEPYLKRDKNSVSLIFLAVTAILYVGRNILLSLNLYTVGQNIEKGPN